MWCGVCACVYHMQHAVSYSMLHVVHKHTHHTHTHTHSTSHYTPHTRAHTPHKETEGEEEPLTFIPVEAPTLVQLFTSHDDHTLTCRKCSTQLQLELCSVERGT